MQLSFYLPGCLPVIRRTILLLFLIIFLPVPFTHGQTPAVIGERVKLLNDAKSDTSRIILLGDLAYDYLGLNLDSSEYYARKAMELAKTTPYKRYYADALSINGAVQRYKGNINGALAFFDECYLIRKEINDSVGMFKVLGNIGNVYNHLLNDFETSLKYYEKSLRIQKKLKADAGLSITYLNISSVYMTQGKYLPALEYLQEAEKVAEKFNDKNTLGKIYLNMGDLFNSIGQNKKGIEYLQRSIVFRKEIGDSLGLANSINNLAAIYEDTKEYNKALEYSLDALRLREKLYDSLGLSTSCANVAIILLALKRETEALESAERSLGICEKLGYDQGIAFACTIIGDIQLALNRPEKAASYCERSYSIISNYNVKEETRDACKCLYLSYDKLNKTEKAFFYFKKFVALDDTLRAQSEVGEVVQLRMKYEYEKKQVADSLGRTVAEQKKETERKEKEKAANDKIWFQQWLMFGGSILFAVIFISLVVFFRINRSKQKAQASQKIAEAELMALRAQMNPHFIFNCLSSIQNFVDKNRFDLADKYLGKFSKLLRTVLITSRKPFLSIEEEAHYLSLYIELENLRQNNTFSYTIQISPEINPKETEIPVMLVQPFVENAIKHGLSLKKENGLLEISFLKKDTYLEIVIKDNGIGREKSQQFKKTDLKRKDHQSMGLQITQERVNLLYKDKIENAVVINDLYDENKTPAGTEVIIKLPLEANHD